jgi:hypothetical protein
VGRVAQSLVFCVVKKDGQLNDKNNKDNKTNNDTQNTTQKTKDWATRTTLKTQDKQHKFIVWFVLPKLLLLVSAKLPSP